MKSFKDVSKQLDEVLTKSTPAGEWVHDFVHSDNPKFAGKSAAKRKQMALAAYYAKKNEGASPSQNSKTEVDMNESKDTSHVINHDSEDVKASHNYVHKQASEVAKRNNGKLTRHSNTHSEVNYPNGHTTHIKTTFNGKHAVSHIKHHYSESVSLDEDQYTSEYKIKSYVDPITGENKQRKIRPHRVDFKNSKMRGEPAQKDAEGDYGMKEDVNESRGHKIIANYFRNQDIVKNIASQSPEEKAEHEKKHREAMTKAHNEYVKNNPNSIFKPMKEEAEQIDELSKGTLVRYINRASQDVHNKALEAGKDSEKPGKASDFIKKYQKSGKRQTGITKAAVSLARKKTFEEVEKWHVYDTKTNKVHSTHDSKSKAENAYNKLNKDHEGYDTPGGLIRSKYGMRKEEVELEEDLDTAHIHQLLANKDINAQVKNGKVHVHSSDVKAAKMHLGAAGHKHEVVGGLNEDQEEDDRQSAEHHQQELERQELEAKKKKEKVKEEYMIESNELSHDELKKHGVGNKEASTHDSVGYHAHKLQSTERPEGLHKHLTSHGYKHKEGKYYGQTKHVWSKGNKRVVHLTGKNARVHVNSGGNEWNEEVQIDEISQKTMKSYVNKAEKEEDKYQQNYSKLRSIRDKTHGKFSDDTPEMKHLDKKYVNRANGVYTAKQKLAKEEVEQIDEAKSITFHEPNKFHDAVDKELHHNKSNFNVKILSRDLNHIKNNTDKSGKFNGHVDHVQQAQKFAKRHNLAHTIGESVQIDELSKNTLASYATKAHHNAALQANDLGHQLGRSTDHTHIFSAGYQKQKGEYSKRAKGIDTAIKKLAKEEVMDEATTYKGIGTDVVDKKKVLNPPIPLTQKPKQVKDFKEGDEYDEKWKGYKGKSFKKESTMLNFGDFLKEAKKWMGECDYDKKMKKEELIGKQTKLDKNHNGKLDADDFKKLRGEELVGKQHKLDKNHNGKLDAQDFKMLRKEETESIEESYPTKQHFEQMAALIKSHDDMKKRSDLAHHHAGIFKGQNPRFDHKKFMHACGVHESAVCEEVEQIDELSKKTLGSYINNAATDAAAASWASVGKERNPKLLAKSFKRLAGISKATSKLTKEDVEELQEVEQIDELSKSTLASYIPKAAKSARIHGQISTEYKKSAETKRRPGLKNALDNLSKKYRAKAWSREDGIKRATDKLAKEEVEQIDELSKKTLGSYAQAATFDAAKQGNEIAKLGNNLSKLSNVNGPLSKLNKRLAGHAKAIGKLTKEEVEQEQSPYLKAALSVMDEGKIDDLRDAQALRKAGASSYDKELKPDTKHPHIKVVKGSSYGGENQKDDDNDEKSDNGEKRGRGRPSGSKSGAR